MKKSLAISLSLILLLSNVGFTLTTHFCGGKAVESAFVIGQGDLGCEMNEEAPCDNHQEPASSSIQQKPCCADHYLSFDLEKEFNAQKSLSLDNVQFVVAFVHAFLNFTFYSESSKTQFSDYSPPLLEKNIRVLFQTFLL